MFRRTSKRPEILGRLDVRLNVLEFQDVYTYFLGRLDVNPQKFVIYTGSAQDDDDNDNDDDDHENHDNDGDDGAEDDGDDGNSSIFKITGVP